MVYDPNRPFNNAYDFGRAWGVKRPASSSGTTQTQSSTGMFGGSSSPTFWSAPAGFAAVTQPQQYDISAISSGLSSIKPYQEYQYSTPGSYGKTSNQDFLNAYNAAFNAAQSPIKAAGTARMRSATQGWGAGQMSSAANKELMLKNAAITGQEVADIGRGLSSDMYNKMISQDETAREKEYDTKKWMQEQQAKERQYAMDIANKQSGMFIEGGLNWLDRQRSAWRDAAELYNATNFSDYM